MLAWLINRLLATAAAVVMFAMMALTLADVVGRNLFNAPLPGGFEVTELALALIIFLGLPLVTAEGGHVAVDICDPLVPRPWRKAQDVAVGLFTLGGLAVLAWMLWHLALRTWRYQDTTAILQIPLAGLVVLMAVMAGLAAVAQGVLVWRRLAARPGQEA